MAQKRDEFSHSKWLCNYHIVFCPKYRRKAIYGQYKAEIGKMLRELSEWKGVEIIEGHLMPDHIHMLVSIPPKISVALLAFTYFNQNCFKIATIIRVHAANQYCFIKTKKEEKLLPSFLLALRL